MGFVTLVSVLFNLPQFAGDKVVLPRPEIVRDYAESVPEHFTFCVKVPNREAIEKLVGDDWSQIVAPKDQEIGILARMVEDLQTRNIQPFILVNNHFEGSAPKTIAWVIEAIHDLQLQAG